MLPSFLTGMRAVQARAWHEARSKEEKVELITTRQLLCGGWLAEARSNFYKKGRESRNEGERQVGTASERCCFSVENPTKSIVILMALITCKLKVCLPKSKQNAACEIKITIMSFRWSLWDRKRPHTASPSITHAFSRPPLERRNATQRTKQTTHRSPKSAAKICI